MIGADYRLFSYEDFVMFESDARSLENTNWLTDNVVNFAVSYLYNQIAEGNPQIRDKASVIYATLCELVKYTTNDGQQMEALLESIGASPNKWLLFLFNNSTEPQFVLSGSHWSLVLYDPNHKQFILFDPMKIYSNISSEGEAGNVYQFVSKIATCFGCVPPAGNLLVSSLVHPIMRMGGECGVYVVEYARAILEALSRNHKADDAFDFSLINSENIGSKRTLWLKVIRERSANEK